MPRNKPRMTPGGDDFVEVELWRWQYGDLPQWGDERKLDIAEGLRKMADACESKEPPLLATIALILRYCAWGETELVEVTTRLEQLETEIANLKAEKTT
jgi:hypothetical protein